MRRCVVTHNTTSHLILAPKNSFILHSFIAGRFQSSFPFFLPMDTKVPSSLDNSMPIGLSRRSWPTVAVTSSSLSKLHSTRPATSVLDPALSDLPSSPRSSTLPRPSLSSSSSPHFTQTINNNHNDDSHIINKNTTHPPIATSLDAPIPSVSAASDEPATSTATANNHLHNQFQQHQPFVDARSPPDDLDPNQNNQSSMSLGISSGLTPRFSPVFGSLMSPGVSGEIANVQDNSIPSTSLVELFRCSEYPYTSSSPPSAPPVPSPPQLQPLSQSLPLTHLHSKPSPSASGGPTVLTASSPLSNPIHSTATLRPPTSTAAVQHPSLPALSHPAPAHSTTEAPPHLSLSTPSGPPASLPLHLPPPTHQQQQYASQQPQHDQRLSQSQQQHEQQQQSSYGGAASGPMYGYGTTSSSVGAAQPPARVSNDSSSATLDTPHGQSQRPVRLPHNGDRSVLGSGIVSSAVQEAQLQARKKAESFASERKRKRSDPVETAERVDRPTRDDSGLTPDERKRKRYERRLALNRESAAVSRVRRREYVKLLEEQLVTAENERVRLATELSDMQRQHNKLREHLQKLEGSIDSSPDN